MVKKLLMFGDNYCEVVCDGPAWRDGWEFYGIFLFEVIPAAELVFQTKID